MHKLIVARHALFVLLVHAELRLMCPRVCTESYRQRLLPAGQIFQMLKRMSPFPAGRAAPVLLLAVGAPHVLHDRGPGACRARL